MEDPILSELELRGQQQVATRGWGYLGMLF